MTEPVVDLDDPKRKLLCDVIMFTRQRGVTREVAASMADAIMKGLTRRGHLIASEDEVLDPPGEYLQMLKTMRRKVVDAINSDEVSHRDLAALTRRAADISREVTTLEERYRSEMKKKGGNTNGATGGTTGSVKGSLDI